ncbi:MFS transporter [Chloroflexota bacterium]
MVAACLLIMVICAGNRFSFGVYIYPLEEGFGITREQSSWIFSLSMIFAALFAVIGGWAIDRYGARVVFSVMGFFTGLGLLLSSWAGSMGYLLISYSLLMAIGTGPIYVVVTSTVSRWFGKRRGLALGIATSGMGIGSISITPLATYLISTRDWRYSFFVLGISAFLIAIPCAQLLRRSPGAGSSLAEGQRPPVNNASPPAGPSPGGFSIIEALKSQSLWIVLTMWVLHAATFFMVQVHIVPHAQDIGISEMLATSILSLIGIISIPGRLIMGWVSDNIGTKRTGMISALLMPASMVLLLISPSLQVFYVFAVLFGFAFGGLSPPITALIGDIFGVRNLGTIMGIIEVGWAMGSAAGPALAGYFFVSRGSYNFAFIAGIIFMLIVAALIPLLKGGNSRAFTPA